MAPPKKQPTNQDILEEIKDIKSMQKTQAIQISNLEQWKIAEDAYRAALKQVKSEDRENKSDNGSLINKDLLKALGLALTALVSLAAFIQASK